MKRVAVGGISHETSTFTPVETTLDSFRERHLLRDREMLDVFRGTNSTIGGYIDGAAKHGFELVPALFADAHTGAPAPRDVFDALLDELCRRISASGPIDGVLLDLHGSMVVGDLDSRD
jgi:microcystin degradation protein MlrC